MSGLLKFGQSVAGRPVSGGSVSGGPVASRPIPYLTGPTAAGKSAMAVELALRIGGEIVSADSRQIYRELSAATAKPSLGDRRGVPHHLVDERSVRDPISAGAFAREAESRIRDILGRGRRPVVVGGSTLHLQALVFGLAQIPAVDPGVRLNLKRRLEMEGIGSLYGQLLEVDAPYAATLDATKSQRILRGLEVFLGTGKPLSSYFATVPEPAFEYDVWVLTRERADLARRIAQRVESMMESGLVDEARRLVSSGFDLEANPLRTIGYHEVAAYLRSEISLEEMVRQIEVDTRRYAKRQLTWLRRVPAFRWIDLSTVDSETAVQGMVESADPQGAVRSKSIPMRRPPSSNRTSSAN